MYVRQARTPLPAVRRTTTSRSDNASDVVLGQRIRRVRIQAGLGLRELAREIGISASSLSDIENNRGGTSLKRLQMVAQYFGLHITDLLAGSTGRMSTLRRSRSSVSAPQPFTEYSAAAESSISFLDAATATRSSLPC